MPALRWSPRRAVLDDSRNRRSVSVGFRTRTVIDRIPWQEFAPTLGGVGAAVTEIFRCWKV